MKWSDIGVQRYESLFESLYFIDAIWDACGPLPIIIITLNILYHVFVFLESVQENHESLPDRLQETEDKLAKAEAQIQETKLAHDMTIANFIQAQRNFDTSAAHHFADMTTITTRYVQMEKENGQLLSEVETLRKAFTTNTAEIEKLQAENKRLNIRLVSPRRKIRASPSTNQENNINNAQTTADKKEFAALQMKYNKINAAMEKMTKTSNSSNTSKAQSTKISTLEADCKIKDGKINKLEKAAQKQGITISDLEEAAESHTTTIDTLNDTLESKDREIEILQKRPTNHTQPDDAEIKSLKSTNKTQESTIVTLAAKLKSADDRLASESKTHRQAINNKIRTIKELNDQRTADLAQKETEKVSASKDAADALAHVQRDHAATLLRKDDEIKAARSFFAQPVQDPAKELEITTLKTQLSTLRSNFDATLEHHREELRLQFDAAKDSLIQETTAAVWEEAEQYTNTKLKALDDKWSSTWDTRVSKYELDWKQQEETLTNTKALLSSTQGINEQVSTNLQDANMTIENFKIDLKTAETSVTTLSNELKECNQNIADLEASIAEWETACDEFERENLKLERKVEELEASRQG